ncbi:hypothetical protein Tco_0629087 [Tanacetum coccineum]|uniref:Uncharacterized protein n=1 Tax=Tanacetum coccineum TaxID=301880 RepID=A0ABQ4WSC6_9ASTR
MSFDDLYNNFKIVKQVVKRTGTSSSNSSSQNMAFVSTPGSTNEANTVNVQVSTAKLILSQLVHKDLEQIHEDDLKEMDLKWQLALLSMRARKYYQRTGKKITINGSDTAGYDKSKKTLLPKLWWLLMELVFDWSFIAEEEVTTNMALMTFLDSEANAVKASACWIWRPTKLDRHFHPTDDQGSTRYGYVKYHNAAMVSRGCFRAEGQLIDDPFSGSTTTHSDDPSPSSSPVKTSDNFVKIADKLAPLNSLPPGNDDSTLKKDLHEENFQEDEVILFSMSSNGETFKIPARNFRDFEEYLSLMKVLMKFKLPRENFHQNSVIESLTMYGYVKYRKKTVKNGQKRTRERMSDQEAKEIKAEAREIMPQPSTVNQSPTPLFYKFKG